jgi:hypothetical protein
MQAIEIYNTSPATGEYIGMSYADPDPLAPENWLLPAHAYADAPPTASLGTVAVRDVGGWVLSPDHRGTVYSTLTGQMGEWSVIGELPADVTDQPRPSPAHVWSGTAWVADDALYASQEQERSNANALAYLAETDWYVIRNQETGVPVPADVLERRAAARVTVKR